MLAKARSCSAATKKASGGVGPRDGRAVQLMCEEDAREAPLKTALGVVASLALSWVAPAVVAQSATATCGGRQATIVGTPGEDKIFGTDGDDVIVAMQGDDVVFAGRGHDLVCGGPGSDTIYGSSGGDRLRGGTGPDRIFADDSEGGNDIVRGGKGHDFQLSGGPGRDRIIGGPGRDTVDYAQDNWVGAITVDLGRGHARGGSARDTLSSIENVTMNCSAEQDDVLIGNARRNILIGGAGADKLYGRRGDDRLYGGDPSNGDADHVCSSDDGRDSLYGGRGHDRLFGQINDDTLDGGRGLDRLWGDDPASINVGGRGRDVCRNGERYRYCERKLD